MRRFDPFWLRKRGGFAVGQGAFPGQWLHHRRRENITAPPVHDESALTEAVPDIGPASLEPGSRRRVRP
jgi:hypothetical protein